jgi:teichuronic acid biosynthesis glycosyltransferase TuaC
VRARLQEMAKLADVRVVAPLALLDYSRMGKSRVPATPRPRSWQVDGGLQVLHPSWLYPPMGGVLNPYFLSFQMAPVFRKMVRNGGLDILDAQIGYPDGIAAAMIAGKLRTPFTVTLRGSEVDHARIAGKRNALAAAFRKAGRVFAVSERLRKFAISLGADPQKAVTIPNGVNAEVYYPGDRQAERLKKQISVGTHVVLTAGHLIELKGHHRAIGAVTRMRQKGLPVRLYVAGGAGNAASYEPELRRLAEGADGAVTFLGQLPQEELAGWMRAADVFCMASRREGWPNVVNEALACGTPVVATDVGAVPEMITSEAYGAIVPPTDDEALERALETALARHWDRTEIARWGQSRGWPEVAREVIGEMGSAIAEKRQ